MNLSENPDVVRAVAKAMADANEDHPHLYTEAAEVALTAIEPFTEEPPKTPTMQDLGLNTMEDLEAAVKKRPDCREEPCERCGGSGYEVPPDEEGKALPCDCTQSDEEYDAGRGVFGPEDSLDAAALTALGPEGEQATCPRCGFHRDESYEPTCLCVRPEGSEDK